MAKNENATLCAALSYVLIGIIWYFLDEQQRKDQFVQYHVRQSVALFIVAVIVSIIAGVLAWIPFIGWLISAILGIVILVLWLIGIIGALQGKKSDIPVVGGFAKSFRF